MSQENVELPYRAADAFNRRDLDTYLALSDDVFEISVVPAPANADTRFLSLKSAHRPVQIASFEC